MEAQSDPHLAISNILTHVIHMNGDSSTHTFTHTHKLPPPITKHTKLHQNLHPCTGFLGSEPMSPFIRFSANESINEFHSFRFCQTQSISFFLPVLTEQQGISEMQRRGRGFKHPDSSKTPHFLSSLVPQKYVFLMVGSSVYVWV